MNKRILNVCLIIMLLFLPCLVLTACDNKSNNTIVIYVDFDSNGGTEVESIKTEDYKVSKMPKNPTKEHCIFKGWFTDDDTFLIPFSINILQNYPLQENTPEKRITVYAKWELVSHTITLDKEIDDSSVLVYKYGDIIYNEPTPEIEEYEFLGWYHDSQLSNRVIFPYTVTTNDNFYAKTKKERYYIRQIDNIDSSIISEKWYYFGDTISLSYPDKVGYNKGDWYFVNLPYTISKDADNYIIPDLGANESNIGLRTTYSANCYTFKFNFNNSSSSNPIIKEVEYGQNVSLVHPTHIDKTLVFDGWFDQPVGGNLISQTSSFIVNSDFENGKQVELYAHWRTKKYTFKFYESYSDFNNEEMFSLVVEVGSIINLPNIDEIGRGLYDCYWLVGKIGINEYKYNPKKLGNPNEQLTVSDYGDDETIIKVYITGEKEKYVLTVNDGLLSCSKGFVISLDIPDAEEGYEFVGYYSEKNGNGTYLGYDSYTVPDLGDNGATLTFYAYFKQLEN